MLKLRFGLSNKTSFRILKNLNNCLAVNNISSSSSFSRNSRILINLSLSKKKFGWNLSQSSQLFSSFDNFVFKKLFSSSTSANSENKNETVNSKGNNSIPSEEKKESLNSNDKEETIDQRNTQGNVNSNDKKEAMEQRDKQGNTDLQQTDKQENKQENADSNASSTNEKEQNQSQSQPDGNQVAITPKLTTTQQVMEYFNLSLPILVLLGVLGILLVWIRTRNQITEADIKSRKESYERYILNAEEVQAVREYNNFTIQEIYELKRCIQKAYPEGDLDSIQFRLPEIEQHVQTYLNRPLKAIYLIQRLIDDLEENVFHGSLSLRQWMFVFSFFSNAYHEERMVLNFSLLDTNEDGYISREEVKLFLTLALQLGWCYSGGLTRQVKKYPPKFEIVPHEEFVERFLEIELPPSEKNPNQLIDFEKFLDLPFRLL